MSQRKTTTSRTELHASLVSQKYNTTDRQQHLTNKRGVLVYTELYLEMQASTLRREFFTSLVGTVPMADRKTLSEIPMLRYSSTSPSVCSVLADLPMPSHVPTPMERSVRGEMPLSAESHKVLSTAEPGLCNKITKALLSVDTSFL